MELDEPFGLYWDERERSYIECTVLGGEERASRASGLLSHHRSDERFLFFLIEQELKLPVSASLRNLTSGSGTSRLSVDPVLAEISNRRARATSFNSTQPKRRLVLDTATLEELTREGFLRLMADARALVDLMVHQTVPLLPAALYVYVLVEPPSRGFKPGCGSRVIALERESQSGEDEVHFAMSHGGVDLTGILPMATGDIVALFEEAFGFAPSHTERGFLIGNLASNVDSLLSEYAGFGEMDLSLRWPLDE